MMVKEDKEMKTRFVVRFYEENKTSYVEYGRFENIFLAYSYAKKSGQKFFIYGV